MAQRTVALCDGKFVGIETIFTVIDGKQINKPAELAALRLRSRKNELFCPCGCGSNLILVASENNLREQHFRLKNGEFNKDCQAVTEGKRSVESKIVLKCWLDDKLQDDKLESRVPIADVSDTERKYEFTFLSKARAIGISYCHDRINLSNEKLKLLAGNSTGISLVHILDACNFKADGQYPEAEMKVQNIQGYCLLLDINDEIDYYSADLRAVFYATDLDGLWQEKEICNEKLSAFSFADGAITCGGVAVADLAEKAKQEYAEKLQAEKLIREEERRRREAYEKEQRELAEKRRIEQQRLWEEAEKKRADLAEKAKQEYAEKLNAEKLAREEEKRRREAYEKEQRELAEKRRIEQQKLWEEAEKKRAEEAEKRRIEAEKKAEELRILHEIEEEKCKEAQRQAELADAQYIKEHIDQQLERVLDSKGNRWIKCEFCGKVAPDGEFSSYGGPNHINLGTCRECSKNNPDAQASKILEKQEKAQIKKRDPNECPVCGGRIVEKMGRYGRFLTCSNYPRCNYKPPKRW